MSDPDSSGVVEDACAEVLAWVRAPHRNPLFLKGTQEKALREYAGQILERFLSWVRPAGFSLRLKNNGTDELPALAGYWTYNGNPLQGPKLSQGQADREWAQILACGELLRDQWCCSKLD